MASQKLLGLLNDAIARELSVSIQYMWQHVMAIGMRSPEVRDKLQDIAVDEMKHAEKIAERLDYLGGVPTIKPTPINVGGSIEEMIKQDAAKEEDAIQLYRKIIKTAAAENDTTTRLLFEEILSDEENHHNEFTTLLEAE
ncbi:MAG: ferritin [Thaumarchaeota archaeon RBG_16_49_8]|nr:MAG: ferritin [Thaumarchaeota archaeon RBG_16_49_8]